MEDKTFFYSSVCKSHMYLYYNSEWTTLFIEWEITSKVTILSIIINRYILIQKGSCNLVNMNGCSCTNLMDYPLNSMYL